MAINTTGHRFVAGGEGKAAATPNPIFRFQLPESVIFEIHGRYEVSNVEEMEARYRDGTLEEADSWKDLQRLDHLEYKRDRLLQLLEKLT